APPGHYILTVRATDDSGASHTSNPVEVFGYTDGGLLSGSLAVSPTSLILSAEGTHDWAHWGLTTGNSFDHKSGVLQQITNLIKIGTNVLQRLTNDHTRWSWSGGTPSANATN